MNLLKYKIKLIIDESRRESMNKIEQKQARMLNAIVRQTIDTDKDIDNYLYASLSQPPIKIIDKRNSDDALDYIVECPNCKSHICYGTDTFMISGHIYCSKDGCREEVMKKNGIGI